MKLYSPRREESYELVIDWNMGNICNFHCDYCFKAFHDGNLKYPTFEIVKKFVDTLVKAHYPSNRQILFSLTGGEVILNPDIIKIVDYMRENNCLVHIHSNGKDHKIINEINANYWILTYHSVMDYPREFIRTITLLSAKNAGFGINVAALPGNVFPANEIFKKIGKHINWVYLYKDHIHRHQPFEYSDAERELMFPKREAYNDLVFDNDGILEETNSHNIFTKVQNKFKGWYCQIGEDQLIVDSDGTIRRGWCRVGGQVGSIYSEEIQIPTEGVICLRDYCKNPVDLSVKKFTTKTEVS